jgi:hypothetical protein
MVRLNFIGIDPKLREDEYSYQATKSFFLEIEVGSDAYRIDVGAGPYNSEEGAQIHIFRPMGVTAESRSLNTTSLVKADILNGSDSVARTKPDFKTDLKTASEPSEKPL